MNRILSKLLYIHNVIDPESGISSRLVFLTCGNNAAGGLLVPAAATVAPPVVSTTEGVTEECCCWDGACWLMSCGAAMWTCWSVVVALAEPPPPGPPPPMEGRVMYRLVVCGTGSEKVKNAIYNKSEHPALPDWVGRSVGNTHIITDLLLILLAHW